MSYTDNRHPRWLLRVILILLPLLLLLIPEHAQAQDVTMIIFRDPDSLTLFVPAQGVVSLVDFRFAVTTTNGEVNIGLNNYSAFSLNFSQLLTPICLRLVRAESTVPTVMECDGVITPVQQLAPANVFWHNSVNNQDFTITILRGSTPAAICPAGQPACQLTYTAPIATPVPTAVPTTIPTAVPTEPPTPIPTPIPLPPTPIPVAPSPLTCHPLPLHFVAPPSVTAFSSGGTTPVFRIGVLDDYDGSMGRGVFTAVLEINDRGGIVGADGTVFLLEAIVVPISNGTTIADAVATLNQEHVVMVIGPVSTTDVMQSLPQLQALGVTVLTPAAGYNLPIIEASSNIFRIRAPQIVQDTALIDYLTQRFGAQDYLTIRLDTDRTAVVEGIANSTATFEQEDLIFESGGGEGGIDSLIEYVTDNFPQATIAIFGEPSRAAAFVSRLRMLGWQGRIAYHHADDEIFRQALSANELAGIIGVTTWSPMDGSALGGHFCQRYRLDHGGAVPDAIAAAGYDAVLLFEAAVRLPGTLSNNLSTLELVEGTQGMLSPAQLNWGEISNNVVVIEYDPSGLPEIVTRYAGSQRVSEVDLSQIATPST